MTTFLIILTSGQFPPRINDIQENWESIGNNSILDSLKMTSPWIDQNFLLFEETFK